MPELQESDDINTMIILSVFTSCLYCPFFRNVNQVNKLTTLFVINHVIRVMHFYIIETKQNQSSKEVITFTAIIMSLQYDFNQNVCGMLRHIFR